MSLLSRFLERTRPNWIRCLILAIFGIAVRFPALSGELIWDDASLVRDNPFTKSPLLIPETFRHYLALDGSSMHYRPIQNISYFFDYLVWNTDPFGFHLSNLLWHVGGGLLLYFLLLRLFAPFRNRFGERPTLLSGAAFFVALFWIVHPVHSAAVDYISGRADSLAFFFACAAWLVYLKARSVGTRVSRLALHLCAAALALVCLCSRESGCIWILLFLFYLFVFDRESSRRFKSIVAAVCIGLVAIYAGLRQLPSEHLLASAGNVLPFGERTVLMLRALGDYAQLMVFPWNLHVERTVRLTEAATTLLATHYLSLIGLLAAAALFYGAFRKGKAQPIRILGMAWFILAYLPVSNLFPLNATVAEHWLYLPSVGFLIFIAGCWLEWPARSRIFLATLGCAALLGLSARSFVRSGDWLNPETFYRQSLTAGAAKTRMALNLAQTYAAQGAYPKAEALLRKLAASNPNYAMAQNALGHLLLREGKTEEAEQVFAKIASVAAQTTSDQPRTWIAALNLAYMKYSAHDSPGALAILENARIAYPETWRLINLESEILRADGKGEKALTLVEQFRESHWWHCAAAIEAGRIYLEQHRLAEAEAALRRASWLDIHDADSLNLIAAMNIGQNWLEAACESQRGAVRRQPDQPRQYFLLADILEKLGRHEEAQAALAQVHALQALAKSQSPNGVPD
jgi:tetratricopeptide (TPR) repeat protein